MRYPNRSNCFLPLIALLVLWPATVETASAGPGDRLRGGGGVRGLRGAVGGSGSGPGEQRQRAPYDDVEGTIWEYKAEPEKPKEGDTPSKLEGRIRLEGNAIFDANKRVKRSGEGSLRDKLGRFRSGETDEIRVPSGPEEERIGEYRKLDSGKVRLDFNDDKTLHGLMLIWPKPDAPDGVWLGQYTETDPRTDKKERVWIVELRKIKD